MSEPPKPDAGPVVASAAPASEASKPDAGAPVVVAAGPATDGGVTATDASAGPRPPAGLAATPPSGAVSLPAGAQIALRMDLALIRASPLAADASALLDVIPDWQRLLGGSGVNPLVVLDRVLIASPSLRQEHMVLAGALVVPDPSQSIVRQAVANLARSRGVPDAWTTIEGRQVAVWANPDDTPRHIALLSDRHFAIAQLSDLPTVLALAQARIEAQRAGPKPSDVQRAGSKPNAESPSVSSTSPDGGLPEPLPVSGPDALLWMPGDTVVAGEVDGAGRLVRGHSKLVPERARLALVTLPDERVGLEAEGVYLNHDEAVAAVSALEATRRRLLGDPVVGLTMRVMGLAATVEATQLEIRDETRIYARFELNYMQVRAIMTYLRGALNARAQRMAATRASSAPATGPASAPAGGPGSAPARPR